MDAIRDLLKDREGEGIAFLLSVIIVSVLVVGISILIILLIYKLIVNVVGQDLQPFWKVGAAGLLASLQNPIYDPTMDAKLLAGWQLAKPVAIGVVWWPPDWRLPSSSFRGYRKTTW